MGFFHPTNVLLKDIKSYYHYDKKSFDSYNDVNGRRRVVTLVWCLCVWVSGSSLVAWVADRPAPFTFPPAHNMTQCHSHAPTTCADTQLNLYN